VGETESFDTGPTVKTHTFSDTVSERTELENSDIHHNISSSTKFHIAPRPQR